MVKNTIASMGKQEKRNVIDIFHYFTNEQIKTVLDTKRHNFSILISNIFNDFNIGTVIRNSNAFLGKNIYIYGRRKYDKRGAVGMFSYEHIKFIKDLNELPKDVVIYGIDNIANAEPIETFKYPTDKHVIFAFGQEQVGLPDEVIPICQKLLYIKQYGSVRSLNVGTASGIVMYDYVRKLETA
jgi:tRNA G18 (ribose-2'-O)-methylase SpoU